MRKRITLVVVGVAAVAAPLAIAGLPDGRFADPVEGQEVHWTTSPVTTNSATFKRLFRGQGAVGAATLDLSADLKQGRAKFRIVTTNETGDPVHIWPRAVAFGKGANSYTFAISSPGVANDYEVQWRRVGSQRAEARSVTAVLLGAPD